LQLISTETLACVRFKYVTDRQTSFDSIGLGPHLPLISYEPVDGWRLWRIVNATTDLQIPACTGTELNSSVLEIGLCRVWITWQAYSAGAGYRPQHCW